MYVSSRELEAFAQLARTRMLAGHGAALLLAGPPGAGKTSFAKYIADEIGANLHYYAGSPDKERDILYEIDVGGVLTRSNAWTPGPCWQAFHESHRAPAVLLIDEVDKTSSNFDAFLLRLLEEFAFRSPDGETITACPQNLLVVLTTNGRRELRPEVLRRTQRVPVDRPGRDRMRTIVETIAARELPRGLLDVLLRLADAQQAHAPEQAPSPKEVALCALDLIQLAGMPETPREVWRTVTASWLVKAGGPETLDRLNIGYRWEKALRTEAAR